MKNVQISQGLVCTVKYLPRIGGNNLAGEVQLNGDSAAFNFGTSHDAVVVDGEILYVPGKASFLRIGDKIVAEVEEINGNFIVTAWTHTADYSKAMELLEEQSKPKAAPEIPVPPSQMVAVPLPKSEKFFVPAKMRKNQTGKDRRGALLPFEKKLVEAVDSDALAGQAAG